MNPGGIDGVVSWLVDGARSAQRPDDVLTGMCERLSTCGVPLWRVSVFVRTLHPELMGRQFRWTQGQATEILEAPFRLLEESEYRQSPVVHIYGTGAAIRRRLAGPDARFDFAVLDDFRRQGATDYFAAPLLFTNGEIHVATFATKRAGGFSDGDIASLEAIVPPLARVAEVRALRRIAVNLLDAYLGRHVGERILSGQIRRGETDVIQAAIWSSDMRGFTEFTDSAPPREVTDLLNLYFDRQGPAIHEHGGEILKFIGDGLLAVFRAGDDADFGATCRRALAAARQARLAVDALSLERSSRGKTPVRFVLALHFGEVSFGNVGGGGRLDFTCIGPAVNLASRLEGVAKTLGRTIVCSSAFARWAPGEVLPVGAFELRGIRSSETVFAPREELSDTPGEPHP